MKTLPPQLTPFVRSDAVGAILAETLGHPEREVSLAELSRRTGVSPAVVHREVQRLIDVGVLQDRQEGRNRLVRAERDHPLHAPMREIVQSTYGPVPVLRAANPDHARKALAAVLAHHGLRARPVGGAHVNTGAAAAA